jgi:NADPH:quinone reductase
LDFTSHISLGGVDVFIDAVGGDLLESGIRSLNWDGRAVVVGFAGGQIPKIPANILLVKNVSLCGLYWGAHAKGNPKLMAQSTSEVIRLWAEGKIKPHISHRFPLDKVNDAFDVIQARQSTGKVILCP